MEDVEFIPFALNPWDCIWGGLWQGGMFYGPQMTPCTPEDQFDVVISMAGSGGLARVTSPDVIQHSFYIDDGALGPLETGFVWEAVDLACDYVNEGKKTLVRCQMGWNRSGLVVALALGMLADLDPDHVIGLIREKRGRWALCNDWFVRFIHEYA